MTDLRAVVLAQLLAVAWWQDPAHAVTALVSGLLSAVILAIYFEWAMRRYQRALDAKLDELRSFDSALSLQAGRLSSAERQLSELRDELRRHREVPPNWDISEGHRR